MLIKLESLTIEKKCFAHYPYQFNDPHIYFVLCLDLPISYYLYAVSPFTNSQNITRKMNKLHLLLFLNEKYRPLGSCTKAKIY